MSVDATRWVVGVGRTPRMSLTADGHLLLAADQTVTSYDVEGRKVRSVRVDFDVRHVVPLPPVSAGRGRRVGQCRDRFVVCCYGEHKVGWTDIFYMFYKQESRQKCKYFSLHASDSIFSDKFLLQ
jgi:hypothetical protein